MVLTPSQIDKNLSSNVNNNHPKVRIEKDIEIGRQKSCLHSLFICLGINVLFFILVLSTSPWSPLLLYYNTRITKIVQVYSRQKGKYNCLDSSGPWRKSGFLGNSPFAGIGLLTLTSCLGRVCFHCIFPPIYLTYMSRWRIYATYFRSSHICEALLKSKRVCKRKRIRRLTTHILAKVV